MQQREAILIARATLNRLRGEVVDLDLDQKSALLSMGGKSVTGCGYDPVFRSLVTVGMVYRPSDDGECRLTPKGDRVAKSLAIC